MSENISVLADKVVSIDYELKLDDGQVVDQSQEEPLSYIHGKGMIIPGLEDGISGMKVGESKEVVVEPEEGYGEYNDEEINALPREAFPEGMEIKVGDHLRVKEQDTGRVHQVRVLEIQPETVTLDFNHPLAGKTLYFNIKVVDVRDATKEELEHGHIH